MIKLILSTVFIILFFSISIRAQEPTDSITKPHLGETISAGIGIGQTYGGIGGNLSIFPQRNIGVFVGVGYALADLGHNLGLKLRFFPKKDTKANMYLIGMYGYNAAVKVSGASDYNKMFYGKTFGWGIDFGRKPNKHSYWSFAMLFPFRDAEVQDYMDDLEDNHGVEFKRELFPFTFSIGLHFR